MFMLPLINLNAIEITHCSKLVITGNQFKSLNSLWDIVDILSYWRQKLIYLVCITWSFFFSFSVKFRYHAKHASSKCGCIMALHNNRRNFWGKNRLFYKNFNFSLLFKWFLMPLILQTFSCPVSLEYFFISISVYIMVSFPAFLI